MRSISWAIKGRQMGEGKEKDEIFGGEVELF